VLLATRSPIVGSALSERAVHAYDAACYPEEDADPAVSDRDNDLAAHAALSEVADRLGNFVERERLVDDGCDRAGFEQCPQLL
jgi:hypothetical protein